MQTSIVLLILFFGLPSASFLVMVACCCYCCRKKKSKHESIRDIEMPQQNNQGGNIITQKEDLIIFEGGDDLTVAEMLEAPGEVIGKSNYGTMYKALLQRSNKVRMLRFLRPVCTTSAQELSEVIQVIGRIRHPNLVPLHGFYSGPRSEKLLVHPFYNNGNLTQFIRDGNGESYNWSNIYRISYGIAKGLEHLHIGQRKPIIHGNLKSRNILLDNSYQPYISDSGLHLLLNFTAGQEMLEASAAQGYRAPELNKMKKASEKTDIYCLGVIFLELISGKEPINEHPAPDEDSNLANFMRNAILGKRISELYHPTILSGVPVSEEYLLKFFQLALACCSPSPSNRPNIKQVLKKLEEVAR